MKINEKTLLTFANSKPVDKEGYLMKRGEGEKKIYMENSKISTLIDSKTSQQPNNLFPTVNKAFQKRWFVLKGNLLFYFEKRGGELLGMKHFQHAFIVNDFR